MRKLKFRILTEFKTPMPLNGASDFVALFPYEDGRKLEKRSVEITNAEVGEGEITLTDFEVQGFALGKNVPFILHFKKAGEIKRVLFQNALEIAEIEGKKAIL